MAENSCNSSVISGTETVSSSGLEQYDVAIYFHETITEKIIEAEKILKENMIETCLSCRDGPAARSKLANLYSIANHSKLRVFVVTDKFVNSQDFAYHQRLLENAEMSTKENTLLLMRKSQQRHIPLHLKDLSYRYFRDRICGEDVAEFISQFLNELQSNDEAHSEVEECEILAEEDIEKYKPRFKRFTKMFGKVSKKRCYILVASPIHETIQGLRHVASIPWVKVFDFDPKSRVNGLLSRAEEALAKRHYTITDKLAKINTPDDNVTDWVFLMGYTDNSDSLQPQTSDISNHSLYTHFENLINHCVAKKVPVILVMWYQEYNKMDKNCDTFLSALRHHFLGRLDSFNCIVCLGKMPKPRSPLYVMLDRLNLLDNLIIVPLAVLCDWICTVSAEVPASSSSAIFLPKYPDEGEDLIRVEVEQEDLIWIETQMNILVMSMPCDQAVQVPLSINDKASVFLKGGEIDWDVIEHGCFDAKRDLVSRATKYIVETHIKTGKSGLVTIFHSPGGGGTTFARRLLFELRELVPCTELTSDQVILRSLENRFTFIRNLTRLPTVLLLDGRPMHEVQKILTLSCKLRIIVIHVRRYYGESKKAPRGDDKFLLHSYVSSKEASEFSRIYAKAIPEKKSALIALSKKVINGESHHLFEYGLIAFQSQFQGVRSYVHGYLQFHEDPCTYNWHTVLVFLSIANYYGHRGLPSKLFGKIFEKDDVDTVDLDDLPHAARQFITENEENWKITHYIVSKLILEQVLVKRSTTQYKFQKHSLTKEASQHLRKWALQFIDNAEEYVGESGVLVAHIREILTAIFIIRDYNDPGENELNKHYSKLLEEIDSKADQKLIFMRLVEKFPNEPEFRAHLGRFFSKQGEFEEAEKCFTLAIEKRKNETRLQNVPMSSAKNMRGDDVLERIYNMAGFACRSHIKTTIGVRLGKIIPSTLQGKQIPTLIRSCLEKANRAIKNFEDGRLWYHSGSNTSFANLGELKVRLQLTELAKQICNGNYQSLSNKTESHKELGEFVLKSFHECDVLLARCISASSKNLDVEKEIDFCFNHFNYFYSNSTVALEQWAGQDTSIHSMKCHLSILKMNLRKDKNFFKLNEDVKTPEQIEKLVRLCEQICTMVFSDKFSNVRISNYMMEWLRAIRHKRMRSQYPLSHVLSRVKEWKSQKESTSLANFFYYVLNTTLSLCSISPETATVYSNESKKTKEFIKQNEVTPTHSLDTDEWLGFGDDSQTFNQLISSTELGEWKGKFLTDKKQIARLKVWKGTIDFCRLYAGKIYIDGGRYTAVDVFFVPQRYSIGISQSKKKTRVEFYMAFNTRHFAEAYEVTLLKKYLCPNPFCKSPTEISVLGKKTEECVATCNKCETLVKIPMKTA